MEEQYLSPFDAIRHIDEQGNEYWSARELYKLLGYSRWEKFQTSLTEAQEACKRSGHSGFDHFHLEVKMVKAGVTTKPREDCRLSRYACYLVVQNSDPTKPRVALGQTYFAIQTRRQELAEHLAALPEDERRLIYRSEVAAWNQKLNDAARAAGVISPSDFSTFTDHGYMGLYGGLRENDIHTRKGLAAKEHILDFMGSEELADNIFRAAQTDAKIRREQIQGKSEANQAHYDVGRKVRQTIKDLDGTMPEDLPTPEKSIQQLQREEQKRLALQQQPSLFDELDNLGE